MIQKYMQKSLINIHSLAGILPEGVEVLKGNDLAKLHCLSNAWLRINHKKIEDFGTMDTFVPNPGEELIDCKSRMVLPAFVDSHTHLVFAHTREQEFEDRLNGMTYQQIAERGGGILNSAMALRQMSEDELYARASARLNQVIANGTGGIEIKSGYGLSTDAELKMLRVVRRLKENFPIPVKATFLGAHAFPLEFKENPDGYVDAIIHDMLPAVAEEKLADYVDVFCEKGYFSIPQTDRILEAACKYGLVPRLHVNQFNSIGGVQAALRHQAASVDHLEVVTDEDMAILAHSSCMVTALPGCSFFLGIPYTPLREMIQRNIAINLATDYNPGSTPSGNMQFVMSLACIQQKLTVNEALNACTINGAAALGLSAQTGSITRGKLAQLIITKPMANLALMPYQYGENWVEWMVLEGEVGN
jgi:imidazolonepropionase